MNIENKYNPSTIPSFHHFMVSCMIKEDIFTLSVYVPTVLCVQATISITMYSELVSQEFIGFSTMWM